jgi:hypothetical protein
MRRSPLPRECLYFSAHDTEHAQRAAWSDWKKARRAQLREMGAKAGFVSLTNVDAQLNALVNHGRTAEEELRKRVAAQRRGPGGAGRLPAAKKPTLENPTCVTLFDANSKVTTMRASAYIDVGLDDLAPSVDPRGWGLSNGVIDVAFRVYRDKKGVYRPVEDDLREPLGRPWKDGGDLLFEYARSEIASFENILAIDKFSVVPGQLLRVDYHLSNCLKTIIGFWGVDGGLQRNDGFVQVTPIRRGPFRGRSFIEVEKNIRVRDLTPNDPGNPYDFGQSINSTIGAALSVWVDDVSLMSPVF